MLKLHLFLTTCRQIIPRAASWLRQQAQVSFLHYNLAVIIYWNFFSNPDLSTTLLTTRTSQLGGIKTLIFLASVVQDFILISLEWKSAAAEYLTNKCPRIA